MTALALRGVLAGVPIGLQLGATGTGGAILGLPLMIYIVGIPVQQAAAMSLVIVALSSVVGAWEYSRQGFIKIKAVAALSWTGMLGAWGGAFGHRLVREEILLILFGVLILLTRALIARRRAFPATAQQEPSGVDLFPRTCWLKVGGVGLAVGVINGLFGVGGGFMIVPSLVLLLGYPAKLAVGTSLAVIALLSVGGILGHLQVGDIQWDLLPSILAGSLGGILCGVRLGEWLSPGTTNRFTASISVMIALTMIVTNTARLLGIR